MQEKEYLLKLIEKFEDQATILEIVGMIDIKTSPDLLASIKKNLANGTSKILVQLAQVEYMDSSGVGVLISGLKSAKALSVPFALVAVPKRVMMVLEMTRLVELFRIFPDTTSALAELA